MSIDHGRDNPQKALELKKAQGNLDATIDTDPLAVAEAMDPFQAKAILQKGAIQVAEWKAMTKGAMLEKTLGKWVVNTEPRYQNESVQLYSDTAWNMYIDNWKNPPTHVYPQQQNRNPNGWISIDDTVWG